VRSNVLSTLRWKVAASGGVRIKLALAASQSDSSKKNDAIASVPTNCGLPLQIRDRIKELQRVRAGGLLPNSKNWRRHPPDQDNALRGLLAEIGYADALLARELPDGRFMIVDA
jgi:hypothetical protein